MSAVDQGARVSPLKPHDELRVDATIDAGGRTYQIRADTPLVGDPAGRHTTWWGVGYHVSHHGESGIGTDKLPAIDSEMAVFGLAEVRVDGDTVARGVPIHVMTADDGLPGDLELDVGDPDIGAVPALPDGHLRVVWESYEGDLSSAPEYWRWLGGGAVLVVMLGGLLALSRRHLSRLSD